MVLLEIKFSPEVPSTRININIEAMGWLDDCKSGSRFWIGLEDGQTKKHKICGHFRLT